MYVIIKKDGRIRRQKRFQREYRRYGPEAEEWADCAGERVRDAYDRLKSPSVKDAPGGRYDDLKLAIENMSGGANTVLLDDLGMPSIMVTLPKMRVCDLYGGGDTGVHPAWNIDGSIKETLYVSKYMNCMRRQRGYSLPMEDPYTYFTFDDANRFCQNKGKGWHLLTNAAWAAIAAWCKTNGSIPRGNTAMGFSWQAPHEKGVPTAMNGQEVLRTASGSGPVTWNHNHNPSGVADLVGNMFEWVGGLRLMDGVLQIIPQGTASCWGPDFYARDSRRWRAITSDGSMAAHGELDTFKIDAAVPGDALEQDHLLKDGRPFLSLSRRNPSYTGPHTEGNQGYVECFFSELSAKFEEKGLVLPELLKHLAIFPDSRCTREDGIFVARNYGERIAVRGGKAGSYERAGLYALHFYNPRAYDGSATIGFRSAFVSPD